MKVFGEAVWNLLRFRSTGYVLATVLLFSCEGYNSTDDDDSKQIIESESEERDLNENESTETEKATAEGPKKDGDTKLTEEAGENPSPSGQFDLRVMLENIGSQVIYPQALQFNLEVKNLHSARAQYCSSADPEALVALRDAWKNAMYVWQTIDHVNFDLSDQSLVSLTSRIYEIDQRAFPYNIYDDAFKAFTGEEFELRSQSLGLHALEKLIFDPDPGAECRKSDYRRLPRPFTNLSSEDQFKATCDYMAIVMDTLAEATDTYLQTFVPDSGIYASNLAQVPNSELTGATNVVVESLFYLDKEVKDFKLATPIGIHSDCRRPPCPCQSELIYSKSSLAAVEANVLGFRSFMTGESLQTTSSAPKANSQGFSQMLMAAGEKELADDLIGRLDLVLDKIKSLNGESLFNLVLNTDSDRCEQNQDQELCGLYFELKEVTDLLKSEFLVATKLAAPSRAQGDQD